MCVRLAHAGTGAAQMLEKNGAAQAAGDQAGTWAGPLGPATAHFVDDPSGYYFIGGEPVLLVEEGVPSNAPLRTPSVGCS
jgi:hypothetical protein